ncbi:MAG: deoxyuridine 5'-triphosphate nucleotidohydrolase [Clostridium sp.]
MNMNIKIKMIDKNLTKIGGDIIHEWYDLRASSIKKINGIDVTVDTELFECGFRYKQGDVLLLGLGLATELPNAYEAMVAPRSGTFKNYGFLLTNSVGVIDNTYRGEWMAMVYCTRDGYINYNDRFLQFRIQKQQPSANITFVDELSDTTRGAGGFGSTGKQ